eukprot:scaffold16841_cov646-Ochromonas_danica.AAC.1
MQATQHTIPLILLIHLNKQYERVSMKWAKNFKTKKNFFAISKEFVEKEAKYSSGRIKQVPGAVAVVRQNSKLITVKADVKVECEIVFLFDLMNDDGDFHYEAPIGRHVACVLFIGHGSFNSMEGVPLDRLYQFALTCGGFVTAFLGCDLGSSRKNKLLFASNSRSDMVTIAFDEKVSFEMIESSGILAVLHNFACNIGSSHCGELFVNGTKTVFRFSVAAVNVKAKRHLNHVIFFNDGEGVLTSMENGLILLKRIPDQNKELQELFSDLLFYHWWFTSKDDEPTRIITDATNKLNNMCDNNNFQNALEIVESSLKSFPSLNDLLGVLKKVEEHCLSEATILGICEGNWRCISAQDLAVGFSRGYRGTSTYNEMCKYFWYLLQTIPDQEDYKFVLTAWLSCDALTHLTIREDNTWIIQHETLSTIVLNQLPRRYSYTKVELNDLLPFHETKNYVKNCSATWVDLLNESSKSIFLGGKKSLLNVTLPFEDSDCNYQFEKVNNKTPQLENYSVRSYDYSSSEFKEALKSIAAFVIDGTNDPKGFDSKEFKEYTRADKMFKFSHYSSYVESNICSKAVKEDVDTFNSLNQCRFVFAYRNNKTQTTWVGPLYFTDVHYGSLILVNQPKGTNYKWDEFKDELMKPISSIGNQGNALKTALRVAKDKKYHPFCYCGRLTITKSVDEVELLLVEGPKLFANLHTTIFS